MTETDLWNDIRLRVGKWPDVKLWRQNTGAAVMGDRLVQFGRVGACDITGILRGGRRVEIELKIGRNKPGPDQARYIALLTHMGALVGVCRSVDDLLALLATAGLTPATQDPTLHQTAKSVTIQPAMKAKGNRNATDQDT